MVRFFIYTRFSFCSADTGSSWRTARTATADGPKDDWKRNDSDDSRFRSRREIPAKENVDDGYDISNFV